MKNIVAGLIIILTIAVIAKPATAFIYTFEQITSDDAQHSHPAISNSGEIVWQHSVGGHNPDIYSNFRGDISNTEADSHVPDISNSGEIVWTEKFPGTNYVFSTIQGQITFTNTHTPTVNNNGEIVWAQEVNGLEELFSSQRGQITFNATARRVWPNINDNSEIVWQENDSIFSSTRGQLTFGEPGYISHLTPAINNLGEFVYVEGIYDPDQNSYKTRIIDSINGPVTDYYWWEGNQDWKFNPDINDLGEIVYEAWVDNHLQLFKATPFAQPSGAVPEPSTILSFSAGILGGFIRRRRTRKFCKDI